MTDRELLAQVIEQSGMSARRYATRVLLRDERTIRRWLDGSSPIPQPVLDFLASGGQRTIAEHFAPPL